MLGTAHNILSVLTHLVIKHPEGRCYYCGHFNNHETEATREGEEVKEGKEGERG